jgi:predicted O-methyltransferase YrrM
VSRIRGALRRLRFGAATLLGGKRGFFIPYRHAASLEPAGYPALEPVFAAAEPPFRAVLAAIESYAAGLRRIAAGQGPTRFTQDWFPRLDAAAAYAMVRRERPARIVEIGSGHSSRFLAQAVSDGAVATEIVCIDPAPRARIAQLPVRHVPVLLQHADPALFAALGAGDVLFVDSSHIAMPGTDVDRLFLDVLPRLPAGVLVHVHDVFLPDPYPPQWAWRGYNEQLLLAALIAGGGYELVWSSRWAATRMRDASVGGVLAELPLAAGAFETSLWLGKR